MTRRKHDVSLRQIEVFARVFESGSFSDAARSLSLSQPTVSAHLKALAESLEVELFRRRGRNVVPTAAARTLFSHVARLLAAKDAAVASLSRQRRGQIGELVLGASGVPAPFVVTRALAKFAKRNPGVHIIMRINDSDQVLQWVLKGTVDVAVVGSDPVDARLIARPLVGDRFVVACAPDDPLAGKRIDAAELRGRRFVVREKSSGQRHAVERALARVGLEFGRDLDAAFEVSANDVVREAVLAGMGLAFFSTIYIADELKRGRLAMVHVRDLPIARRFFAVTARDRAMSSAVRELLTFLKA